MAKLAQAQEPSMEEILASIRRIISDEEMAARPGPASDEIVENVVDEADMEPPEAGDFHPRPAPVLHLSEVQARMVALRQPPGSHTRDASGEIDTVGEAGSSPLKGTSSSDSIPGMGPELMPAGGPLLSPGTDAVVTSAFDNLASMIMSSQARTLEDLVKDMLRPMLKAWLDTNLPVLVERLVRDEIERVSRGRR